MRQYSLVVGAALLGAVAGLAAAATVAPPATAGAAQGGRFQIVAAASANGWIILDSESGKFERWVLGGDKWLVEASHYGATQTTDQRQVPIGRPKF